MFKFHKWVKTIILLFGLGILISCIFIVEQAYAKQVCKTIDISIAENQGQDFIQEKEIITQLAEKNIVGLGNTLMKHLKSKNIENIIKKHDYVRFCTVYKTWKGHLKVNILPKRPIARVISNAEPGHYIDDMGTVVPLSKTHTARVLLVNSEILCKLRTTIQDTPYGKDILKVFNLIDKDPFWRAQIVHISIDNRNELILHTQFNRQKVYFGKPDNIEEKMKKLKLFYTTILLSKGWNAYKRVNLKFDNQIVCE